MESAIKMKSYDFNMGADENCVLQYLQDHAEHFLSEMEIARRADGRHRFMEDAHWAHVALSQLVAMNLAETDGLGRYRLQIARANEPANGKKFMDPRLRQILERSGKKFDLSCYA